MTWVSPLIAGWRAGALNADELWTVVLDCYQLDDPQSVVDLVLRGMTWKPPGPEQNAVVGMESGEFMVIEFEEVS